MAAESPTGLKPWQRLGLSALLIGHLIAVFFPPLAFQTSPSPSVATVLQPVEGYSQFMFLDRGYAFFAPDPGPSHLIQARIETPGQPVEEILYPDRQQQWPRLLYHRHFMISEFLQESYQPPVPSSGVRLSRAEADQWARARLRYEHVRQSILDHLRHEHPGSRVELRRVEHLVPDLVQFQLDPIELTDERLYRVLLDRPVSAAPGELTAPAGPPETIPPPEGEEESPASTEAAAAGATP